MITIEMISPDNVAESKTVRLRALRDSPTAFSSTFAEESKLSDADWLRRASQNTGETTVGYLAMDANIACGVVRGTNDEQDTAIVWVQSMWVDPVYRRNGVGRLLINKVVEWARGRGKLGVKLEVTSSNEAAIHFYETLGFAMTGKTRPYRNDASLLECEMILPLNNST